MDKDIELDRVRAAMKEAKDRRMYERYQTIYLYLKGMTITAISDILDREWKTVKTYVNTYNRGGLSALQIKFSPGIPTRMTEDQHNQLEQVVANSTPQEVGFTGKHKWTLELIVAFVKREWGHQYTIGGMSRLMKRLGLTKPTYTLREADSEK